MGRSRKTRTRYQNTEIHCHEIALKEKNEKRNEIFADD